MLFECRLCTKVLTNQFALVSHLKKHKISARSYYYNFLKKDTETGICTICGKETNLNSITKGLYKTCSTICSNKSQDRVNKQIDYYFPDFYIPKLNLIIEIKSWYTEKLDKNVSLKEQACKNQGYNYIRILDNNFENFNNYLKENL